MSAIITYTLRAYMEARIDKSGGPAACWPWTGGRDRKGYPKGKYEGRTIRAHRVYACVPQDMLACHVCDNPPCCNPAHIVPGTPLFNNRDRATKGRNADKRGEKHHLAKITEEDVRAIRAATGTQAAIAAQYGVNQAAVSMIRSGKRWGHVT